MRAGGDPRDDSEALEVGIGGVSGNDGGLFNSGDSRGVRGDGGRDSGSGISIGTAADREVDGIFDTMDIAVRSLVRSLVTRCVLCVDTGSPEDSVVQREASLLTGGDEPANSLTADFRNFRIFSYSLGRV
jgi:hypothetical protein